MSDESKKLQRSADDRWVAGVCGGIAEYFNVDSTLVRVLFVLFGFAVGGGILIYIILWLIMPAAADVSTDSAEVTDFEPVDDDDGSDGMADSGDAESTDEDVSSDADVSEE